MTRTARRTRPAFRRAISWFLLLNLLAIAVVATGAIAWSIRVARARAVQDAIDAARSLAVNVVAPLCTPALRSGDPTAIAALDRVVRDRLRDGSVLRVKIWTEAGRVIYSDANVLIGHTYDLSAEDRALFGTDHAVADVSALARPENELEATNRPRMVESYVGFRDTAGEALLFEAYFPAEQIDADARAIAWDLTPVALVTILALQTLQLPLALVLARRLDHAHGERARLLEHAVAASDLERRRIARDLHDGVIQDLAGVGYMLDSVEPQLDPTARRLGEAVRRAAEVVQRDVRTLRQMMVDLSPLDMTQASLDVAVNDLVRPLREAGIHAHVAVADTGQLSELTIHLIYRAARELLRNVASHAQASEVSVTIDSAGQRATLEISDDGIGFDPATTPPDHAGLRLLAQAVHDSGGSFQITSAPGAGTTVRIQAGTS